MSHTVQGGVFNLIPLSNAITEAKRYLKIQDTTDDDTLEFLAWNAVRWMAPLSSYGIQHHRAEVCNGRAKLPNECISFMWYTICCPDSEEGDNCCYVNSPFLAQCGVGTPTASTLCDAYRIVTIRDGYIDFCGVVNFEHIDITYMGYKTDDDGVFMITDTTKVAVSYKICAEYCLMEFEKYGKVQQTWERKAMFASNKVKSIDFSSDFKLHANEVGAMLRAYYYPKTVTGTRGPIGGMNGYNSFNSQTT